MAHIVPLGKVNQFVPHDKLEVENHTTVYALEETSRDLVAAKLGDVYDVSEWWGDDVVATTPSFILNLMSMYIAGIVYNRQFAEESTEGNTYGNNLVAQFWDLLEALADGTLDLQDEFPQINKTEGFDFALETEPVFTMDDRF